MTVKEFLQSIREWGAEKGSSNLMGGGNVLRFFHVKDMEILEYLTSPRIADTDKARMWLASKYNQDN